MSRTPRLLGRSGFMHIYSRGVNKQDIFLKKTDYNYFLEKLSALSDEMGFEVLAYCLMPNHYHLVLFDENARYSTIIKRLSTSYVMHFNNKYSRVGPLFQGRFCGKPIEDDIYLMTVIKYVHMNPQKAGICKMQEYKWSSYQEYVLGRKICNTDKVINLFGGIVEFMKMHNTEDIATHAELENEKPSDEEAVKIICSILKDDNPTSLVNYSRQKRDMFITEIKNMGIQNQQLARVTGLSMYVIRHVRK